jgi:two-component system CheB/CheR fusion protein
MRAHVEQPKEDEPSPTVGTAFPIVGIGASAGGLEALEELTRRLSHDGMAYVVIQHLAPGHESTLTDILARGTSLQVVTARDGVTVETNTIYVTPPSADIALRGGVLRLAPASSKVPRYSIDAFFRTLATDAGAMSIGVILSGAGTDGTLGLGAIKEQGGITFVQEPSGASQPSMPQSAIDAGCADFCLSPQEIGDELMRLSAHPYVTRKRPARLFNEETLKRMFDQLRRAFGVDFSAYKRGTVERRIERRMALQKLARVDDYLTLVESNPDERNILYSDLLIGVTGFFRDRDPFEALKSVVFPRLLENRSPDVPIRIWVPACATGEEAYSLAICILEYMNDRPGTGTTVQIFGTDIDEQALARARLATYPKSIELDVSPERLQRFFSQHDKGYQVSRQVRDMVVFARHNLGRDPPFSRLDLVSCRNVLIYMQAALQRKVLQVFHYALNPDGYLLLGTSESVGDASDRFSLLDRSLKIYLKKNMPSSAVFDFSSTTRAERTEPRTATTSHSAAERRPTVTVQQLADRKVLEKFGPPGLLVDENMDVIQFRGQTGPYLSPTPGTATLNALKLIRPELLLELRTLLRRVASDGVPALSEPVRTWGERGGTTMVLEVMPLADASSQRKCFLVLFRELPRESATGGEGEDETKGVGPAGDGEKRQEPRVQELERELLVTKEYLQTTVQELESANEELQSSTEELQSSNEELQSTNEELETSKEELQSTNEELATVNEELQNRVAQLTISNDDLQNVLTGVSAPFVIVGMDLRIRRFSADAERLLNLIPGDVGRPIAYLGSALNAPQFEALVSETINSVRERGQRVRCSDGHWYTARVLPYRSSEHSIRGALIEFLKAPSKVGEPVEIHEFVGKVLSTLPHVLMLLDPQLKIVWVNKRFFETFVVGTEILGRPLDDVWAGRSGHPDLWNALEETASGGKPFSGIRISDPFGRTLDRVARFSARCIPADGDRPALTLVVIEANADEDTAP